MATVTHENHFRFGWGDGVFNMTEARGDREMHIGFGAVAPPPTTLGFRKMVNRTCELIANSTSDPIVVALSGGIDSEMVCRGFKEIGADFSTVTVSYKHRQNQDDIKYARVWCRENNIENRILELDIEWFMDGEMYARAQRYPAEEPYQYLQMWVIDQIEGFPVFGGGDIALRRWRAAHTSHAELPGMFYRATSGFVMPLQYLLDQGRSGAPRFFIHTPEMAAAWLLDPNVDHFIRNEVGVNWAIMSYFKAFVCHLHYPEMVPRIKLNSFEGTTDLQHREKLKEVLAGRLGYARLAYEHLMSMLGM